MAQLSVVLATYNEEKNLRDCLASIQHIADEIIVVDGTSTDKTVAIAKQFGASVYVVKNQPIFHINKQKALSLATKEWILQLDADERVTSDLAKEIVSVISLTGEQIEKHQANLSQRHLFLRHQKLLEERDGAIGTKTGSYTAFFIPRRNFFLGRYLRFGGVYPDGVIRLVKKGNAHFPAKDVHEQIVVEGMVGWLGHDLLHNDSPTFGTYLKRWQRYTSLIADDLKRQKIGYNPSSALQYLVIKPMWWFLLTYGRHKGFLDGWQGFVFSFFSAMRFPAGYSKYLMHRHKT